MSDRPKKWINDYGDIPWWYWVPRNEIRWLRWPDYAQEHFKMRGMVAAMMALSL